MRPKRALALLSIAMPAFAQYAGPAILTRGEAPAAMAAPEIRFRPFLEVVGVYDSGLAAVAVSDTGQLARQASYGVEFGWGVSGMHSWRHTKLGLDYRGAFSHYVQKTFYDSIDQSLLLGVTHQFSRRTTLSLNESAGMFSRDFGLNGLPQTVPFDPSTSFIPRTDYFDNRTIYLTSQANLTIQKTARLSFSLGGVGFINRRRSSALYGAVGEGAQGDVEYRVSRRSTIGANYGYQHYGFTHVYGGTDVHMINFVFARQLTRWVEFSGFAGAFRGESKFLQSVAVDPVIAILLGITSTSQVVHNVLWGPNFSGRLSRTFQTGVVYIAVGHSITPGNGLFLTSTATSVIGGYGYTGLRRWSMGAQIAYDRAKSIGIVRGVYSSESASLTAARQIIRSLHFIASYSARRYDSPDFTKYNRLIHSASVGLGWAPGDVPLRIW